MTFVCFHSWNRIFDKTFFRLKTEIKIKTLILIIFVLFLFCKKRAFTATSIACIYLMNLHSLMTTKLISTYQWWSVGHPEENVSMRFMELLIRSLVTIASCFSGNGKRANFVQSFAVIERMTARFNWIAGAIGSLLLFGFMFLTFGVLTTKFTLFEIVLRERLAMNPIYPSYFWWKDPEPEVLLKLYVFNITNSAEFIAGTDKKLKLQEIGPITFQEILQHKDVVFHSENSTLSYTATRHIVFKESANVKGILNQTVTIPNMASLSGCSFVADSFLLKRLYNGALIAYNTQPVVTTTIYNYFFNLTEPVL